MRAPRSPECKCDPRFTCRYCLDNRKPAFYTLADGSALPAPADFAEYMRAPATPKED